MVLAVDLLGVVKQLEERPLVDGEGLGDGPVVANFAVHVDAYTKERAWLRGRLAC